MINAQHAHIYRIHTLHFIFGEIFFLKILSIQPLPMAGMAATAGGGSGVREEVRRWWGEVRTGENIY
jgi:hypothetical protein